MDGWMDGRMDGPTDRRPARETFRETFYRDAWMHIEKNKVVYMTVSVIHW